MAQGILQKMYQEHGISGKVDSAGFESFHINEHPDPRAIETAARHGIDISGQHARLFSVDDFDRFDRIYVMDLKNYRDVMYFARTDEDRSKVDYLMNLLEPGKNRNVPDPYYLEDEACHDAFLTMEKACHQLIGMIKAQ